MPRRAELVRVGARTGLAGVEGNGSALIVRLVDVVTDEESQRVRHDFRLNGSVARRIRYCCQNIHVLTDK